MRPRLLLVVLFASLLGLTGAGSAQAAFPGANGKIAFASGRAIWAVNPDGTGMAQLSFPPAEYSDVWPAWSPEGDRIAFDRECCVGEETNSDLYVMNADGSGLTQLTFTTGGVFEAEPSWSPDGTKIAFDSPNSYMYTMNADGSGVVRLTDFVARSPNWSPNGNPIAFTNTTAPGGIGLINADGSGRTALTSNPFDYGPSWSPDGTRVAFSRSINAGNVYRSEVFTVNADGSAETNRTNDTPLNDDYPAWSPDGKKIAWQKGYAAIWIMNADGSGQTDLGVSGRYLDWQPLPGPRRSEFQNAAHFCKAERTFMGESAFTQRYGDKAGANAFGKCVSADEG